MRARAVGKRLPAAGIYSAQSRSMTLLTTLCSNLVINPATHRRIWDGGKSDL